MDYSVPPPLHLPPSPQFTMEHLPAELVSGIFHSVIESHASSPCATVKHWAPILLLNHRLRNIALATPGLWTDILLNEGSDLESLQRCLSRSKACELDVVVDSPRMDPRLLVPGLLELKEHVSRWSTFTMDMGELHPALVANVCDRISQSLSIHDATALKSLEIALTPKRGDNAPTPVLQHLRSPEIRHLALKGVGLDWTTPSYPHLRTLKLRSLDGRSTPSFEALETLLQNSSYMNEFELIQVHMPPLDPLSLTLPESTVPLNLLRSLTLKDVTVTSIHHILSRFSLPQLQRLIVGFHSAPDNLAWSDVSPTALDSVVDFEWCSTTAQAEEAHRIRIEACLEALLNRLRGVKTLRISGSDAFRRLSTVTSASSEDPILPQLCTIECTEMKGLPVDTLVVFLKAHSRSIRRLSVSALDFSMTASVGQRMLEAVDDSWREVERVVGKLNIKDRQDHLAFRYTFIGWRDYQSHLSSAGRQLEYDEQMEE